MHVRGRLADRSPADILEWIQAETKTGVLRFYDPLRKVRKDFWFHDGKVVSSGSNNPREWLGQFLMANGTITEEDFIRAYRTQVETRVLFGKVLAMIGLASEAEVHEALQEKTNEAVLDVFLWNDGYFEFEDDAMPLAEQRLPIDIHVDALIAEGETRQIEWGVLRQLFPSSTAVPQMDLAKLQAEMEHFGKRQKRMLTLAVKGKSFAEIALDMHMPEFRLLREFKKFHNKSIVVGVVMADPEIPEIESTLLEALPEGGMPPVVTGTPSASQLAAPSLKKKIPSLDVPIEQLSGPFSPEEGYILSRIDGQYDLGSILMVCPFQERVALDVVEDLLERGVITLRDP